MSDAMNRKETIASHKQNKAAIYFIQLFPKLLFNKMYENHT